MRNFFIVSLIFTLIFANPFKINAIIIDNNKTLQNLSPVIQSFHSDIQVLKNRNIVVTETILYDFLNQENKHGIVREIPTSATNSYGKTYSFDIDIKSITDEKGLSYEYSVNRLFKKLEIKIGNPNILVRGIKTYKITYEFKNVIQEYSDHAELYWNITGNLWKEEKILSASSTVTFEEKNNIDIFSLKCFTGTISSKDSNCNITNKNNTIFVKNKLPLKEFEGITLIISTNKEAFPIINTLFKNPLKLSLEKKDLFYNYLIIINFIGIPLIFLAWFINRDPKSKIVVRQYEPPIDNITKLYLTPIQTGLMMDERIDGRDISAEIINLAVKKYIKITETDKQELFFKTKELIFERYVKFNTDFSQLPLSDIQKDILKILKLDLNETSSLSELKSEAPSKFNALKNKIYEDSKVKGYFKENPESTRSLFSIIAFMLLMTGGMFIGIAALAYAAFSPKKTKLGVELNRQAKGLKQYLTTQERSIEYMEKNYDLFEKLLPYAIVFGVAKIWSKRFENLSEYKPDWYTANTPLKTFNSYYLVNSLSKSLSTLEIYYTPTSSTSSHGFSSGIGKGGFSGGGFGGGGGRSW